MGIVTAASSQSAYRGYEYYKAKNGCILPEDYVHFLMDMGGGVVNKDKTSEILLPEINERIAIDVLFGLGNVNQNANIAYWTGQYKFELTPNTIIFGDDLMQGFLVMICEGKNQGVYYWDDAFVFSCSNEQCTLYRICASFSSFMKLLLDV